MIPKMISPNGYWFRNVEGIHREFTLLCLWNRIWKVKASKARPVIKLRRKPYYKEPEKPG